MRIIAGTYKGRRLKTPKGFEVRPTSDRVKESLFSIFGERVIDADFLDLCAGTGNIGIEALSRGAKSVTFIEGNRRCIRFMTSNLERCGLSPVPPQVRLLNLDARKALSALGRRKAKFDLIYFDPPYDAGIYHPCLERIAQLRLLSPSGLTVVEHRSVKGKVCPLPDAVGGLRLVCQRQYGDTVLSFYEWEEINEASKPGRIGTGQNTCGET